MRNSFKLIAAFGFLAATAAYSGLVAHVFGTNEADSRTNGAQSLALAASTSTTIPNAGEVSEIPDTGKAPDTTQSATFVPEQEATGRAERTTAAESLKQALGRLTARHGVEVSGADLIAGDAPAARDGGLRTRLAALLAGYNHIMVSGDDEAVSRLVIVSAIDHKAPPRGTVAIVRRERQPAIRAASVEEVPMVEPVSVVEQVAMVERKPVTRHFVVYFDFDSARVSSHAMKTIGEARDFVRAHRSVQVNVVGYTDRAGSEPYNQKLSEKRASAVAAALGTDVGADKTMTVWAFGELMAAVPTADGVAERRNRRVEIVIEG